MRKLEFDITQPPPTSEQIAAGQVLLDRKEKACRWVSRIAFLWVACWSFYATYLRTTKSGPTFLSPESALVSVALFVFLPGLIIVLSFPFQKYFASAKKNLSPIDSPDLMHWGRKVLAACRDDRACDNYRLAVITRNRAIVVGEADMLVKWAKTSFDKKQEKSTVDMLRSDKPIYEDRYGLL